MVTNERIIDRYPVDPSKVDVTARDNETNFMNNVSGNLNAGIVNPMYVRYYEEDPNNPAPVNDSAVIKDRYRNCKLCTKYDTETQRCDLNNKYIPIYLQFEVSTCPSNKWEK